MARPDAHLYSSPALRGRPLARSFCGIILARSISRRFVLSIWLRDLLHPAFTTFARPTGGFVPPSFRARLPARGFGRHRRRHHAPPTRSRRSFTVSRAVMNQRQKKDARFTKLLVCVLISAVPQTQPQIVAAYLASPKRPAINPCHPWMVYSPTQYTLSLLISAVVKVNVRICPTKLALIHLRRSFKGLNQDIPLASHAYHITTWERLKGRGHSHNHGR